MPKPFQALVVDQTDDGVSIEPTELTHDDLPEGSVSIQVAYSSVNYKDGLACLPDSGVARRYPLVPGIDLAGTVTSSTDPRFKTGDKVLVTGYDLGVSHHGGFSEYARVPGEWVVPLPQALSLKESMALGTAGFTAGLAVQRLENHGLTPDAGPVLVTGATGGVGSTAISMLANNGYEVAASTGKQHEYGYLRDIGAQEILPREETAAESGKALQSERWAGAVDPVGGNTLTYILCTLKYGGSAASIGLTGSARLNSTVYPFILRSVNLLGIDSVYCPMQERTAVWKRLATDLKPPQLVDTISREIRLDDLEEVLSSILEGKVRGRVIVKF